MNRTAIKDEVEANAYVLPRRTLIAMFRAKLAEEAASRSKCHNADQAHRPVCREALSKERRFANIRDVSPFSDRRTIDDGCELISIEVFGRTYFAIVEYFDTFSGGDDTGVALPVAPRERAFSEPVTLRLIA